MARAAIEILGLRAANSVAVDQELEALAKEGGEESTTTAVIRRTQATRRVLLSE